MTSVTNNTNQEPSFVVDRDENPKPSNTETDESSNPTTETVSYRGRVCQKIVTEAKPSIAERVGAVAAMPLIAVGALVANVLTLADGFRGILFKDAIIDAANTVRGMKKDTEYKDVSEQENNSRKEKYDPTSQKSLLEYVENNSHNLMSASGHHYLINYADSAIIFMPYGKEKDICEIKFFTVSDGADIVSSSLLEKATRAYLVAYEPMQKKIQELPERERKLNDFVLDLGNWMIRGYKTITDKSDLGVMGGVSLDIDKEVWKEVTNFFDSNKTKGKRELEGEPVHRAKKRPHFDPTDHPFPSFLKPQKEEDDEEEDRLKTKRTSPASNPTRVDQNAPSSIQPIVEEPEEDEK